jgi:enoyl-CoA hydratase
MDEVLYSVEAGIGRITINRPDKRNAMSPAVLARMRQIIAEAGKDRKAGVVTLTGAGEKMFCAGVDLKASLAAGSEGQAFGRSDFRQLLVEIARCPKPTVALVRGHVMGGGIGIITACDLCFACDDVHFSTPEIHVGMFPMMVMGLLYRNLGRKKATEMLLLGDRITAAEAAQSGLINRALPREQFEAVAAEYIQKLSSKSSVILAIGKRAISRLLDKSLQEEEQYLESALVEVMATDDSKEGIRAFVEKRKPNWS